MHQSTALGIELDRLIGRLGDSSSHITLLSLSTTTLPAAVLLAATRAVANRSHSVGPLNNGTIGVLALSRFPGQESLEDQFVPRLRTMIPVLCDDPDFDGTTLYFRAAECRADELRDSNDLMQILLDRPLRAHVVPARAVRGAPSCRGVGTSRPEAGLSA